MSIDRVRQHFGQWNMQHRIMEFQVSSATVELAAQALGCEPARIAKTLSFQSDGGCILLVAAGDARVDNAKFKQCFGVKARMLSPDEALAITGHAVGGVCPFGVLPGAKVYLDESLKRFETVFPACGSASSAIELSPDELSKYTGGAPWVDVCKGWQAE
jgi:prolyl-tRNA editing enzyme YbaK/EbsC (Cys-tRNA(Pro) deacylase)